MSQTKLYVGNLPFSASNQDLETLFESCGEIDTISIVTDRETGRSRGFAFVEFTDAESAQKGAALDGNEMGGRQLRINFARDDRRSGGGGRDRY